MARVLLRYPAVITIFDPIRPVRGQMAGEGTMRKNTDDCHARPALSRRGLFKQLGLAGAAAAVSPIPAATGGTAPTSPAAATPVPIGEALETLTAAEADVLEAIVARLIPTDENGPGAAEARAAHYIDRASLARSPLHEPLTRWVWRGSTGTRKHLRVHLLPSFPQRIRMLCCWTWKRTSPPASSRTPRSSSKWSGRTRSRAPSATLTTAAMRILWDGT